MREGKKVIGSREKMELLSAFFASVFMQKGGKLSSLPKTALWKTEDKYR